MGQGSDEAGSQTSYLTPGLHTEPGLPLCSCGLPGAPTGSDLAKRPARLSFGWRDFSQAAQP